VTTTRQRDVVDLLVDQHNQIKSLFGQLGRARGTEKRELFERLVRLLAVHESAEEIVVHPTARRKIDRGHQVVDQRLQEEDLAKYELAELDRMGVDHPDFDARLARFADAVVRHASHEENEEFPSLRRNMSEAQLTRMAGAVRAAEAVAPTRPHPHSGESATANLLVGPVLAIFDRARDAVRDWRESQADRD
jgi:hemerythrin superfamily protein